MRGPAFFRGIDKLTAGGIEEVEHIGAAPAVQLQEVHFLKMFRYALYTKRFAAVAGVVEVNNEPAVHIDQQHRILISVGDGVNADPLR